MHVRDFVRGGYKNISEPTIVTKHGREMGTWIPARYSLEYAKYLRARAEADESSSR